MCGYDLLGVFQREISISLNTYTLKTKKNVILSHDLNYRAVTWNHNSKYTVGLKKLELSINVSNEQFSPRVLKNEFFSPLSSLCFVNFFTY